MNRRPGPAVVLAWKEHDPPLYLVQLKPGDWFERPVSLNLCADSMVPSNAIGEEKKW